MPKYEKMMRNVAIVINARLASSRCPRKLVREFAGTTLIELALDKLSRINAPEKYIAAGDEEIIDLYHPYSKSVNLLRRRQDSIAGGEHHHSISFRHYQEVKAEYILIMNPCMPFTKIETYEKAIHLFQTHPEMKTLTSVLKFKDIFFNDGFQPITLPDIHHVSTTTCKLLYKMAHIFHIIDKQYYIDTGQLWSYSLNDPAFQMISSRECLDVDNEDEFEFCESLYAKGW